MKQDVDYRFDPMQFGCAVVSATDRDPLARLLAMRGGKGMTESEHYFKVVKLFKSTQDRNQMMVRLRRGGETYKGLSELFAISTTRCRRICLRIERREALEAWFAKPFNMVEWLEFNGLAA